MQAMSASTHRMLCADFPWLEDPKMLNNLYLDTMRSNSSGISSSPLR